MTRIGPSQAGLTVVEVEDGLSVYNPATGRALVLNRTAADIWLLCDGTLTQSQLRDTLADAYGLPASQVASEVDATLALLRREGLATDVLP